MAEDRYICLACSDRPFYTGKFLAYTHAREAHADELDHRHVEELFEVHGAPELNHAHEHVAGPFFCELCDRPNRFMQRETVETHLKNVHSIASPVHGEHFVTELDRIRMETEKEREIDRAVSGFGLRVSTLRGVTDFLTECGA